MLSTVQEAYGETLLLMNWRNTDSSIALRSCLFPVVTVEQHGWIFRVDSEIVGNNKRKWGGA